MHYTQVYHSNSPSEEVVRRINQMPKVELHVHLEGATSPELLFAIAARNKVALPVSTITEWRAFYEFQDFNHFIEVYLLTVACMKAQQDFTDMVVDFMAKQAMQNILYTEVFFSSSLHIQRLPGDEILYALKEGIRVGREKYGVDIALIPDISRQTCVEKNIQAEVLDFALKARELGIGVGLGIAGKEIGYPARLFQDTVDEARRQGLHFVAHAGETGDHHIIRDVLETLQPERIGHGIRSLADPLLVEELRKRHIPIEVSPQSNYCTRVVQIDAPHPIRAMVNAGLNCTVNSDDPAMFSTSLTNDYLTLAAQGFTFAELWQLNRNSMLASFLDNGQRDRLTEIFDAWIKDNI